MVVTRNDYGRFHTLTGTLSEVVQALGDQVVPAHKVISIFWDGTTIVAVYHK
jgi:hypothetical protein